MALVKQLWTYGKMKQKILRDLDLEDETFITPDELIGYFNEGLNEAASEILALNEDYFLAKAYLPVMQGVQDYALPYNIYANKIRGIMYQNGAVRYPITQFRRKAKFEEISFSEQYAHEDWYKYLLTNDIPGQTKLVLHPPSRETAILSPYASRFVPFIMWYTRDCNRIPLIGEWCNPELMAPTQAIVDPGFGPGLFISTSGYKNAGYGVLPQLKPGAFPGSVKYKAGDKIRFTALPGGSIPTPLVEGREYFVKNPAYPANDMNFEIASSKQNALNPAVNGLTITSQGTLGFVIEVVATPEIIDATLIDIPEFSTFLMQWVKTCCLPKDGDPRYEIEAKKLVQQKAQMVDTLTKAIDDDDDEIQADFSIYQELS